MRDNIIGSHPFGDWRIPMLRGVLSKYGIRPAASNIKPNLWDILTTLDGRNNILEQEYNEAFSRHSDWLAHVRERKRERRNTGTYVASDGVKRRVNPKTQKSERRRRIRAQAVVDTEPPVNECSVCTEPLSSTNQPTRPISAACTHQNDVCRDCVTRAISSQFTMRTWDSLSCPGCGVQLAYNDIQAFADPEEFQRYCTLIVQSANVL